jgi:light-regulated signal transduction histidine kinase (bacteriophytochrome)
LPDEVIAFGAADLDTCAREQIHIPGSVQPHGCLLALAPDDLRVVHVGGDTLGFLGAAPHSLLDVRLSERIGPRTTAAIQGSVGVAPQTRRLLPFGAGLAICGREAQATVHHIDGLLLLELEPADSSDDAPGDSLAMVQGLVARVQRTASLIEFCQTMVECVREVSGFDRVMMYRFLSDETGSVEAEAHAAGMTPYLGLRYPASDIPAQARELYLRNTLRLIPDARYAPAPLFTAASWPGEAPLDLSYCSLRSVSPIHLEYLANMGVVASMSISIVVDSRLWGLIACHHRTARFLAPRIRIALDLFGQMVSFQLETRIASEAFADRMRSKTIHETMIKDLAGDIDIAERLQHSKRALLDYIKASGLALWIDGEFAKIGTTPREAEVRNLVKWLNDSVSDGVFHTDCLSAQYVMPEEMTAIASGILAISVSRVPRDYLIWFRPEQIQSVRWAGDPSKSVTVVGESQRPSPRKSFAAWKAEVRGRSEPWTSLEVRTAESLRLSLLEIVLEHVDQLARERQRARIQQDALLAQLDDRIAQWERTAEQLKVESDRRAVLEMELSEVLRRTVVEQEIERQRIARELHDSLGQYLTAVQLDLEGIARDKTVTESIKARVERLKGMTADAGHEVNSLAWEIRPTLLDDLGLQTAFQQFLEDWRDRSQLQFDLHLTLNSRRLGPAIESTLYRVLQEAIRNVVKHAEATRVGVILEATDREVRLIIEDNGKGFLWRESDAATEPSSRLGLLGIRERLALIGGRLEIETLPGHGATLLIHVPI